MWNNHIFQFLGFFIAGLAVNLTPCVYPMLTVTASLFKPREDRHETLQHSFFKPSAYFLGIALMYSSLGYFAASTGRMFGSLLQNSFVLGGMALMIFLLALSMFGHFELRVPSGLLNLLSGFLSGRFRRSVYWTASVGIIGDSCA